MSRILCVIDGMTDPHFQVEQYGHLASMGSMRYVDTSAASHRKYCTAYCACWG